MRKNAEHFRSSVTPREDTQPRENLFHEVETFSLNSSFRFSRHFLILRSSQAMHSLNTVSVIKLGSNLELWKWARAVGKSRGLGDDGIAFLRNFCQGNDC